MRSTLAISLCAFALAGCGLLEGPQAPRYDGAGSSAPKRGGTLTFHHEDDVRGLDPHVSFDELSGIAIGLLFDSLIDYDAEGHLVPALVREMPRVDEDGKRYTFVLREGVRFHSGRELVASDVAWSLERMLAPATGSPGAPYFAMIDGVDDYRAGRAPHIRGIEVDGRATVRIRLSRPDHTFLNAMAMHFAAPIPRENFTRHGRDIARHPVGTGPFELDSWEPGVRITFKRNTRYWEPGKPYLDGLVYELNLHRETAFMRFRSGDIDHVHRFTPADRLWLRSSRAWAPYRDEGPYADIWGVEMNCEMAPFDNVHMRRAVAFAIDRERWARARNFAISPNGQALPSMLDGYDTRLAETQRFDLDAARRELALAGHPNGYAEPITLWLTQGSVGRIYGELIQADLGRIGLRVELKFASFPVYLQQTGTPHTAQMLLGGWSRDFLDPASFFDPLFHSRSATSRDSSNRAFYKNREFDALIDRAHAAVSREERAALYREANAIVTRDAPWAFAFSNTMIEAWQPYVKNYARHPVWTLAFRNVWLDLPRKPFVGARQHGALGMLSSPLPWRPR